MKNYRKAIIASLCAALCVFGAATLSGCKGGSDENSVTEPSTAAATYALSTDDEAKAIGGLKALGIDPEALGIEPSVYHESQKAGFQLEMPEEGDTIAVIHTDKGDITLRLFPEQAPKAVTNFINLANDKKYNNTTFLRVVKDFVIQGGHCGSDITALNGVSSYGAEFEDEFCDKLFNLRGAVSMASSTRDSNGSQFFINQTTPEAFKSSGGWLAYDEVWEGIKGQLISYKDSNLLSAFVEENGARFINTDFIPNDVKQLYVENGGNPALDGAFNAADRGNTVFGQVISGMEAVDEIASVETDDNDAPVEEIKILSIEIKTYSENEPTTVKATEGTTAAGESKAENAETEPAEEE